MSSVIEVKAAVERLAPQERQEFFRWLSERDDFQQQRLEDLRRAIAVGVEQADRGELAPLDIEGVRHEARRRALQGD